MHLTWRPTKLNLFFFTFGCHRHEDLELLPTPSLTSATQYSSEVLASLSWYLYSSNGRCARTVVFKFWQQNWAGDGYGYLVGDSVGCQGWDCKKYWELAYWYVGHPPSFIVGATRSAHIPETFFIKIFHIGLSMIN